MQILGGLILRLGQGASTRKTTPRCCKRALTDRSDWPDWGERYGAGGSKSQDLALLIATTWRSLALQFNNAPARGDRNRLRAIVGAQLVHDVLDMHLDRILGDEQLRGDIPIPVARCDFL